MVEYMKIKKYARIFLLSIQLYCNHMRKNIFAAISVSVSIFLFLSVALYIDFRYSTYESAGKRVQDNYFAYSCFDKAAFNKILEQHANSNHLTIYHASAGSTVYSEKGTPVRVYYNLMGLSGSSDNIYVYSNLDQYGNVDSSNIYNYEKFNIIAGTDKLKNNTEIVISEDLAKMLAGNVEDALGIQIMMALSGSQKVYTVAGIYESLTAERRINKDLYENMDSNMDDEALIYTVLISEQAIPEHFVTGYDIYVFYDNQEEYMEYKDILNALKRNENISNKFSCITAEDIAEDNKAEWSACTDIKCALLLVVSLISGISILGTMANSVSDRRKEIGIKKALGAKDTDIMIGFVFENLINSIVAIVFSVFLTSTIFLFYIFYQRQVMMIEYTIKFYPVTWFLFVCYAVSAMIGFSLIPAYSASQINIIDTLRVE